jgi:hypothetical protein
VDIRPPDWPTTGRPIDPEAVKRVLAHFDRWHPIAVRQLAELNQRADEHTEVCR